jgi:RNA 3'-phosphate cyclase
MRITGGTDVPAAPPLDYFRHVLLPLLSRMGVTAKIDVLRRGYYPRGGGEVVVDVEPSPSLSPLILDAPGKLNGIAVFAHVANLPAHVLQRLTDSALAELSPFAATAMEVDMLGRDKAIGPGGAIVLIGQMENTRLAASATAQRGVPAEQLGTDSGRLLAQELMSGATLDVHAADQVLIYLALAPGISRFLARSFSPHAATAVWLLEQFLPVRFQVQPAGGFVGVTAEPRPD